MKKLFMLCLSLFLVSSAYDLSAMKKGEAEPVTLEGEGSDNSKTVKKKKSKKKEPDLEAASEDGSEDEEGSQGDSPGIGCCTLLSHPISIPDLTDEEYTNYLKTSHNAWRIAGHFFKTGENILDAIAYVSTLLYPALPSDGQAPLMYTMLAVGVAKLICIRFVSISQATVQERAVELAKGSEK